MPSERSARAKSRPAEILVTRFSTATRAGTSSPLLVVPRPSWPRSFRPQAHTVPSDRRARLNSSPAATWVMTPLRPLTWTGVDRSVVVPSPSAPCSLIPQAVTVPSDRTARLWVLPAAT